MELQRTENKNYFLCKFNLLKNNKSLFRIIICFIFFCIVYFFVISSITPQKYRLSVGDIAKVDIISPKDVKNEYATENLIKQAESSVGKIYIPNKAIETEAINNIEMLFEKIYKIKDINDLSDAQKADKLKNESNIALAEDDYIKAIIANNNELMELKIEILKNISIIFSNIISDNEQDIKLKKQDYSYLISSLKFKNELRDIGIDIGYSVIKPNMMYDSKSTEDKIIEIRQKYEQNPVMIRKNQKIIGFGEVTTLEHISILKSLGMLEEQNKIDLLLYIGTGVIIILIESLIALYIYKFYKDIYNDINKLLLIILMVFIILFISKFISVYKLNGFIIPIAFISMLIAVLLNYGIAIILSITMSIFITIILGGNIDIFIFLIISGCFGAIIIHKMQQRSDLITAGFIISLINFIAIFAISLISSNDILNILKKSFIGVLNGLLSSILAIGFLPFCETTFKLVTPIKLLELSNPNQPLLKKLLFEAPGTYHHSIIVGNLAEAAVDAINGNSLIARVGAYYHDVGKINRPYFFKENQIGIENPHDNIAPSLSTLIIINHIKDGVETAKKYKIPKNIINMIVEHHGTTLIKYFYVKAINENVSNSEIEEKSFRYEGPKPKTRESAVLMLADSVEAAVRSITIPSRANIEDMVKKVIKEKIDDEQLNECDITLKDINKVTETFLNVLNGIYHERIEYPEINKSEVKSLCQ